MSKAVAETAATRIVAARKRLKLSRFAFAKRCGVSYTTAWRWEKGQCEPRDVRPIARALGVTVAEIRGEE